MLWVFKTAPMQAFSAKALSRVSENSMSLLLPKGYIRVREVESEANRGEYNLDVFFGNKEKALAQMEQAKKSGLSTASLDLHTFQIKMEEFFLLPIIFFLALVLITPARPMRKLSGAALGLLLLLVFFSLKLTCFTLYNFSSFPVGVYEWKGWPLQFVTVVHNYVKMGAGVLLASLVWALVIFRHSDWRAILQRFGA